jgi:glutathione S-transferase
MAGELTLYVESSWMSLWCFHAVIAVEEKALPYKLEVVPLPMPPAVKAELQRKSVLGKVPILVHGDVWVSESLAISEYLAEVFPHPDHPRLFPADFVARARARQVMSFLRTSLGALREERPTSSVFGQPLTTQLSEKARADANELVRVADAVVQAKTGMFGDWCIADADLSLALMRMVANQDPMPSRLVDYALAQFDRSSVKTYFAHLPATP